MFVYCDRANQVYCMHGSHEGLSVANEPHRLISFLHSSCVFKKGFLRPKPGGEMMLQHHPRPWKKGSGISPPPPFTMLLYGPILEFSDEIVQHRTCMYDPATKF